MTISSAFLDRADLPRQPSPEWLARLTPPGCTLYMHIGATAGGAYAGANLYIGHQHVGIDLPAPRDARLADLEPAVLTALVRLAEAADSLALGLRAVSGGAS